MVSSPEDKSSPVKMLQMPKGFLTTIEVEPVGRWFLSHWERLHTSRGLSTGHDISEISESESDESETEDDKFEDDIIFLRSLDPKESKDQDHYKVLGISQLRYKATDDEIKKAYRYKVLRHHPDKRRALGEDIREDDDYFTCITKAFEILGVPSKRRAYDSVDPEFDDHIPDPLPSTKSLKSDGPQKLKAKVVTKDTEKDFFSTFSDAFERNARWSTRTPVPKLGSDDTSREKVEKFYKFWYAFESWREYSYLDEEDKESGSDRDERRWIEKNNRIQRAERKKEEMKRIRTLVDNSYNSDPRVMRFREAERQEKADRKKAKVDAAKARKDEEERLKKEIEEKERAEKEAKELEEKKRLEAEKREKDIHKKALKKERRELKTICKQHNFFCSMTAETEAKSEEERVHHMTELDKLCEILSAVELEGLNDRLKKAEHDQRFAREIFIETYNDLNARLEKEKLEAMEKAIGGTSKASGGTTSGKGDWTNDELALLIKAVNLFPAGTTQRWEVVASFINQHTKTPAIQRAAKETLAKAKELQSGDFHLSSLKEEANKKAYENLEKQKKKDVKIDDAEASIRTETAAEVQGLNMAPWSAEEQKLLEQALKTYPASVGSERWENIAGCLPNRSKKDCMKRYKEIAEIVRAKKAAQAAAKAGGK